MISRTFRAVAVFVAAASVLSACEQLDTMTQGWFTPSGRASKLKGERISVMQTDEIRAAGRDAIASTDVVLPPPYRNDDWANPRRLSLQRDVSP